MPNTKSAKKKLRQDKKRTLINDRYRIAIKKTKKELKKAVEQKKDKKVIENILRKFYSIVDKAAKRRVIHKNKAARLKSRAVKFIQKVLS